MKALTYHGFHDVRLEDVATPSLQAPDDAIIRVTHTAICGSDLHLIHNLIPDLPKGMPLGHETMGIVAEVGPAVKRVRRGDRVVVAFPIACGTCCSCQQQHYALCDDANPQGENGAIFGYGQQFGAYPGGQAEYLRVPYADVGLLPVPDELTDEQVLFLSDILPTGWFGCAAGKGADVAVDCVGLEATMSTWDKIETFLKIDNGSIAALSQAIQAVKRGGSIGVVGVYGGRNNFFPWGEIFAKGLRIQAGQCPVQKYWHGLLDHVKAGRLHPEAIITHRLSLAEGPHGYQIFDQKQDGCIKVVMHPKPLCL